MIRKKKIIFCTRLSSGDGCVTNCPRDVYYKVFFNHHPTP